MNAQNSTDRSNTWVVGAILILLGIIFMLQNFTLFSLNNWWALFILIPAIGSFERARREYRESGHMNTIARNSAAWGVLLTLVTAVFLFNLSWSLFLPLILIVIGLILLVTGNIK
jgi:hypothetical protein